MLIKVCWQCPLPVSAPWPLQWFLNKITAVFTTFVNSEMVKIKNAFNAKGEVQFTAS